MKDHLIAKKVKTGSGYVYQTLEGHVSDVLTVGSELLKQIDKAQGKSIDADTVSRAALTVMAFHDFGKHLKEFQHAIQEDETTPKIKKPRISHALYSAFFIDPNLDNPLANWVCSLSILSHHSSLHKSLFSGQLNMPVIRQGALRIAKDSFESLAKICELQSGWPPAAVLREPQLEYVMNRGKTASSTHIRDQVRISDQEQIRFYQCFREHFYEARQLYALVHMVLKLADESASSCFAGKAKELKPGQTIGPVMEQSRKVHSVVTTRQAHILNRTGYVLYPFQRKCAKCEKPMLLVRAPCGRGKTLAVLLNALRQKRNRIVFCLPTQITSNAMAKELSRLMKDPVGFYHGLRKHLKLDEETQEITENWLDDTNKGIQDSYRSDLFYSTPVVVSTVDHLVYSLIRAYPQADVTLGNLMSAVVIYDEIHAYEEYTLRQILGGMHILHRYGIPQILMSATLPSPLGRFCQEKFGATFIEDHEGLEFSPVIVEKRSNDVLENLDEISSLASKGRKVLVVTNTVARSRLVFDRLSASLRGRCAVHLYNSLFTPHDRSIGKQSKEVILLKLFEKGASGPAILVATQAVEMSLNICADVLFSDWCPIDALVQRTGRVNRGGERASQENRAVVCPTAKDAEPYFAPYSFGVEEEENEVLRSWDLLEEGPLSHAKAIQAVDEVYKNMDLHKEEKITRLFRESTLYGERINILGREEDPTFFNIRNDPEKLGLATISVVPTTHSGQFRRSLKGVDLYILKVPLYWLHKYPGAIKPFVSGGEEVNGLYEIEAPYNSNTGLSIDQFDEAATLIV